MNKITRFAVGALVVGGFTLGSVQAASAGPVDAGNAAGGGLQIDVFQGWDATGMGDIAYTVPYGPERILSNIKIGTAAPAPSSGNLLTALGNARPVNLCVWCV